ncbi:hypothetical protein [Microviridae sp.]|nr:hypothetical protein [Microviridae sp.]
MSFDPLIYNNGVSGHCINQVLYNALYIYWTASRDERPAKAALISCKFATCSG